MSETTTTVPMDDKALFDAAISDAPAETIEQAPAEAAPTEQAKPEGDNQPRDEHGRFAPKAEATEQAPAQAATEPPAQPVVQPAPVEAKQDPPPGWIPAWRAREIADARVRELENKLKQLEKPQEPIDPWADLPKYTEQATRQAIDPVEQRMATLTEHYSRKAAIASYGEQTVREAYGWLQQATNNGDAKAGALLQRAMKSIDPFDDIVTAYKSEKAIATVGNDPEKWFEAELERRKADPAFVAKHLGQSQPNGATQPTNVVKLPPSLNRQPGTSASAVAGTMDDKSLYEYATR